MYLLNSYFKIYKILNKNYKLKFVRLQLTIIFASFLEAAGILSIIPYVIFLQNFSNIKKTNFDYEILNNIFVNYSDHQIIIFASILTFSIFVFSNISIILSNKYYINFSRDLQQNFARRLIDYYLNQNFEFINKKKSNTILFNVLSGAARSVNSVIYPCIQIISKSLVSLIIIFVLALTNLIITLLMIIIFGILFYIFSKFYKKEIKYIASKIYNLAKKRQESAKQAIDFYFDTVFFGKKFVIKNFLGKNLNYLYVNSRNEFITFLPKYVLEIFAFGSIALLVPLVIILKQDISQIVPTLVLYVVSGYKLMPTAQSVYSSCILVKTNLKLFNDVSKDLINEKKDFKYSVIQKINTIKLKNVSFSYNKNQILKNVNFFIKKGSILGIKGPSGIGKSTFGFILSGLIKNYTGEVTINGKLIKGNIDTFNSKITYLNSNVNTYDFNLKHNIFFSSNKFSKKIQNYIISKSELNSFLQNDLKNNIKFNLSQSKINLSTGQKQRLGIARALFKDSELIVLDEATNGLDRFTEDKILKYLKKLSKEKIIIIISHKKQTLKLCDEIYYLRNKKLNKF